MIRSHMLVLAQISELLHYFINSVVMYSIVGIQVEWPMLLPATCLVSWIIFSVFWIHLKVCAWFSIHRKKGMTYGYVQIRRVCVRYNTS